MILSKFVLTACLSMTLTFAVNAQALLTDLVKSPDQTVTRDVPAYLVNYSDWVKECRSSETDTKKCEISTSASSKTFKDITNSVNLVGLASENKANPVFYFRLPLGYLIAKKPILKVDGRKIGNVSVRTCQIAGCILPFKLNAKLLSRFKKGTKLTLDIHDLGNEKHTLTYSLIGFTKAYNDSV